jgi:hypothetical protein
MLAGRELWYAAPSLAAPPLAGSDAQQHLPQPPSHGAWLSRLGRRLGLLSAPDAEGSLEASTTHEDGVCVFCGVASPHTPVMAPCGHVSCYFCIARARMASTRARCPRCAVRLKEGIG